MIKSKSKKKSKKQFFIIIDAVIEAIIISFTLVYRAVRAVAPAFIFAMFLKIIGGKYNGLLAVITMIIICGGILSEFKILLMLRRLKRRSNYGEETTD